jgi:hypothetical protein
VSMLQKARELQAREFRTGRVIGGPVERTLFRLAYLDASSLSRSIFPVACPTAIRSSNAGSGDHAKHYNLRIYISGYVHGTIRILTFMCGKSCREVTCRISGKSGAHSYRVI